MPVPLEFLRGVVGVLCVLFGHVLGRSIVRVRRGARPRSMYGWLIRAAVCLVAVLWRSGFDRISIAVFVLTAVSLAVGVWDEQRPKRHDDLSILD